MQTLEGESPHCADTGCTFDSMTEGFWERTGEQPTAAAEGCLSSRISAQAAELVYMGSYYLFGRVSGFGHIWDRQKLL